MSEYSFDFIPNDDTKQEGGFSIAIDTLQVEFDLETLEALGVWGYSPAALKHKMKLWPPTALCGSLHVDVVEQPISGMAYGLPGEELWKSSFDPQSGWVCISKEGGTTLAPDDVSVECAKNTIAVIRAYELVMLWIHPEIVA